MSTVYHVAYWKSLRNKNMRTFQFRWLARLFGKLCEVFGYRTAYVEEIHIPNVTPLRPRTRDLCRIFFQAGICVGLIFSMALFALLERVL